jgi:hypothetical protein
MADGTYVNVKWHRAQVSLKLIAHNSTAIMSFITTEFKKTMDNN